MTTPLTPLPLPPSVALETPEVLRQLTRSHRQLAELKGVVGTIPNESILIDTLALQEAKERAETEVQRHHEYEVKLRRATEQCLQQERQRVFAALQRKALDEAVACERAEELQQMAHRGRGWPQLRQAATAPTEGEPTVGDDEALTRDWPTQ